MKWPNAIPNLQPRDDIWPTDRAPVIRRLEDGTNEFGEFRWGFPPGRPKGAPVINFRSEGRRFPVREEITEVEVAVHEVERGLVLLCRAVASYARAWCGLHASHY